MGIHEACAHQHHASMNALALIADSDADIVFADEDKPRIRAQIQELEDFLLDQPQESLPVRHIFANGLYLREADIPAGLIITGSIHLDEHANILSRGSIRILTEDGVSTVTAPQTFICRPGVKKVGVVISDVVMTNIHPNPDNLRDINTIEARLFVRDYPALNARQEN